MNTPRAAGRAVWLVAFMTLMAAGNAYSQDDFKEGVINVTVQNEDGSPAAGLEVQRAYWDLQIPRNTPLDASERATTDVAGRCTFSGLPRYHYMLHASTANVGAWKRCTLFSNQTAIDVTLILKSLYAWTGTVCDDQGNPLPGVMVCVERVLPAATTGEDGKWRIDNVPYVGEVSFTKEGYGCAFAGGLRMMNPVQVFMRKGVVLDCRLQYADGRAGPDMQVNYNDMKARTDKDGRFRTVPFPPGEKVHFQAWLGNETKGFRADSTVKTEQEPVQEVTLQFEPYGKAGITAAIAGKVVRADTLEPVRARILFDSNPEFASPDDRRHTQEDGTFLLGDLRSGKYAISVAPYDPTLYPVDGILMVDVLAGQPVQDLTFKVAVGCAIRGCVLDTDGKPVREQVLFKPSLRRPVVVTQPNGFFIIPNLPQSDVPYTLEVRLSNGQSVSKTVGPVAKGQLLDNVEIRIPSDRSSGMIKGTLVDTSGKPVEGVPLRLVSGNDFLFALPNSAGAFETPFKKAGEYRFTAEKHIPVGQNGDILYTVQRYRFVEGEAVTFKEGESIDVRVVVEAIPTFAVGGQVIDETGAAVVRPQIQPLVRVAGWRAHSDNDGWFVCQQEAESPFFVEFVKPGYRAVVIECGKQLNIGDLNSRVVMKKGPFPDGESVFTLVTGLDDKPESWTVAGVNLKERVERYRSLAQVQQQQGSPRTAPTAPKEPAEPPTCPVRVTDAEGRPVTRVFVQPADSYTWSRPSSSGLLHPDGAKQVMNSPDGTFNVKGVQGLAPNAAFVSADGTGAVLVRLDESQEEGKPVEVVLHPAARIIVHVTDYDGQPLPEVAVGPAGHGMDFYPNPGRLPVTDATGAVMFDLLPPGVYSYQVYAPKASKDAVSESVTLNVDSGQIAEGTVRFGEPTGESPEAEVQRWRRAVWSREKEGKPPVPDAEMKAMMAGVISRRLNELPGKDAWEVGEAGALAKVAQELGLKSVAPALVQIYSRLAAISTPTVRPAGPLAEAIGALGGDEAIDALRRVAESPGVSTETSTDALIALCALRSEKAIRQWAELRDAAFRKHGAPKRKESYTHAEKISETIQMTFHVMPLSDLPENQEWTPGNLRIWVAEDYKSAKASFSLDDKGYDVLLERFGPEWIVVGIDHIVMS